MKKGILLAFLMQLSLLYSLTSYAWGIRGHQLVAEIAFHLLDESVRQKVQFYLGRMSIQEAATWMDDVRSNSEFDFMKPWHFLNLEKGEHFSPSDDENIVNELNEVIAALRGNESLSRDDIKNNLLLLFHLIGDLHQPLHVGYGTDRGGNKIKVAFLNTQSNLHKVWDSDIIRHKKIGVDDCFALYESYSEEQVTTLMHIDVVQWFEEVRSLLNKVYQFQNGTISASYIQRNQQIIKQQLLYAGIRLAAVLEEVFRSAAPGDASPDSLMARLGSCPPEGRKKDGGELSERLQQNNILKNRTKKPRSTDFDNTVTLQKMLRSKDKEDLFDERHAATITGYLFDVRQQKAESCNCHSDDPDNWDFHIYISSGRAQSIADCVVIEITPYSRRLHPEWTLSYIRDLKGKQVRITGWLFYDSEHTGQSLGSNPNTRAPHRRTVWELHPVTNIVVVSN